MKIPCVVGIPTLTRYDLLDRCIKHLLAGSVQPSRIIVVDNGGSFKSPHDLVDVVRPNRNLGVAASWNLLCRLAEPEDILLLNDDFFVAPRTLERMHACDAPFVIVGGWACILMRDGAWQQVGFFDEEFYPAYYEDNDHHWRMRLRGYDVARLPTEGEVSGVASTLAALDENARARLGRRIAKPASGGAVYYTLKWGGMPGDERFTVPFNRQGAADPLTTRFLSCCAERSDINEHLPTLYLLARECNHVTELGFGRGNSTTAFLCARPRRLVSVDIEQQRDLYVLMALAGGTNFEFVRANSLEVDLDPTDLLFIDTLHTYGQLSAELARHSERARRWIVLHDTTTFGEVGEDGGRGLWPAVQELLDSGGWRLDYRADNNNGLTILERTTSK